MQQEVILSETYDLFSEDSLPSEVTAEKLAWVLSRSSDAPTVLVELGPGLGALMQELRIARPAWIFFGIEPHPPFAETVRARGFSVFATFEEVAREISTRQLAADTRLLVVADNVVEHLTDPVAVLRELRAFALRVGMPLTVLVEVPNERGLQWRQVLHDWLRGYSKPPTFPGHVNLFERRTLIHAAKRAGFSDTSVEGHGIRTRGQIEYLLRSKVQSEMAPRVAKFLRVLPVDSWCGLTYWLRGDFRA